MSPSPAPPKVNESTLASAAPGRERAAQEPAVVGDSQAHEKGAGTDHKDPHDAPDAHV